MLTIDALAEITGRISGSDISRLWRCGSKRLNYKLGICGGVKKFDVKSSIPFYMHWPILVASLQHLHTFRFMSRVPHSDSTILNVVFNTLPSTIKHIEVAFIDDAIYFHEALVASPDRFTLLETVILSGHYTHHQFRPILNQADLIRTLPASVMTILITKHHHDDLPPSELCIDDIPPNITHMQACDIIITPSADEKARAPSRLASFWTAIDGDQWMSALPPQLESLTIRSLPDAFLHLLPPSLTELTVEDFDTCTTFLDALPRTLTKLDAPLRDDLHNLDLIRLLPPRLTTTSRCFSNTLLSAEMVAALPRTLTDLPGAIVLPCDIVHLPRNLTSLSIHQSHELTIALFASCTWLEVSSLCESMVDKLPRLLKHLVVRNSVDTPACFAALPSSLISLTVRGPLLAGEGGSTATLFDYFSRIPRGLRKFTLNYCQSLPIDCQFTGVPSSAALPRTLEVLSIALRVHVTPEWHSELPPALKYLYMNRPIDTFTVNDACALQSLSRLTYMSISAAEWEPLGLAHMPPALHTLSIFSMIKTATVSSGVTRTLLAALPRRILDCRLPIFCTDGIDSSMHHLLPATLSSFVIGYMAVTLPLPLPHRPRRLDQYD